MDVSLQKLDHIDRKLDKVAEASATTSATVLGFGQDIEVVSDILAANQSDQERQRVHDWLQPPDPFVSHTIARSKYERLTNRWLLDSSQFSDWIQKPRALLSVVGIPGSGKTILASSVIAELEEKRLTEDSILLYFYFDFNDRQKQSVSACVASLVLQMALIRDDFRQLLILYTECGQGSRTPTLDELLDILDCNLASLKKSFLIFDALDECSEADLLSQFISDRLLRKASDISILVTSRKLSDFETETVDPSHAVVNLQQSLVDPDIQTYIRTRLANRKRLAKWCKDKAVKKEIETTLTAGANGM